MGAGDLDEVGVDRCWPERHLAFGRMHHRILGVRNLKRGLTTASAPASVMLVGLIETCAVIALRPAVGSRLPVLDLDVVPLRALVVVVVDIPVRLPTGMPWADAGHSPSKEMVGGEWS